MHLVERNRQRRACEKSIKQTHDVCFSNGRTGLRTARCVTERHCEHLGVE